MKCNEENNYGLDNEEYELFEKLVKERDRIGSSYPDDVISNDIAFRKPTWSKRSVELIILGEIHKYIPEDEPWGFMKEVDHD